MQIAEPNHRRAVSNNKLRTKPSQTDLALFDNFSIQACWKDRPVCSSYLAQTAWISMQTQPLKE